MAQAAREEIANVLERTIDEYTAGDFIEDWDLEGLFTALSQVFPMSFGPDDLDEASIDREWLIDRVTEDAGRRYEAREAELGEELMRALERYLLLQIIDERWREHLYDMDYLREGIHLRGFAQIDPLVAYKNEAFELFGDLMRSIWSDFTRMIFNVQVTVEAPNAPAPAFAAAGSSTRGGRVTYSGGTSAMGAGALAAAAAAAGPSGEGYAEGELENGVPVGPVVEQRVVDSEHQVGRNDPCWCGSGKKFKRCHGA
jgi:preprotein translocase subunit SecA